jgi:hypothetical protein
MSKLGRAWMMGAWGAGAWIQGAKADKVTHRIG